MEKTKKYLEHFTKYFFFLLLAFLVVTCFLRGINRDLDFQVFYKVGARILQGDLDIYNFTQDGIFSFKYSPTSALLFAPLALIAKTEMQKIWSFLNVICTFLSFYLSYALALYWFKSKIEKHKLYGVLSLTLIMLSPYYVNNSMQGNINSMIYLLIVGSLYLALVRKHTILPAVFISLAVVIKVIPITFLCFFFFTKYYRIFFLSLLLIIIGMAFPFFIWGSDTALNLYSGWANVLEDKNHFPFLKWTNQSPNVIFYKMTGMEIASKISLFIHFIVLCVIGAWALLKRNEFFLFLAALMAMLWLSPVVWLEYYLCVAVALFIITLEAFNSDASKSWRAFFILRLVVIYGTGKFLVGKVVAEYLADHGIHYWGGIFLVLLLIFIPQKRWLAKE